VEQNLPARPLGLYLHIPWCLSHCRYCNFFTRKYSRSAFADYFQLLLAEKELYLRQGIGELSTVYFGGGTPSLLSAAQISELVSRLPLAADAEITLELNPIQITPDFVQQLRHSPVNRLSLGLQSMLDEDLGYLGRRHRAAQIPDKLRLLRDAGYSNISADFIYGLPDSTIAKVQQSLQRILELPLQHISCYLLEIYDDSELAEDLPRVPADEILAEQYHSIRQLTQAAGFEQYEISNFARPGYTSRHNLLYWQGDEYLAWGASASGYFQARRYRNPANLEAYARLIRSAQIPAEIDSAADELKDHVMMGLRLSKGLNLAGFKSRFGQDFAQGRETRIAKLLQLQLIELNDGYVRLTAAALFISNAVIGELL
jgi:oxygen-independent coproporphyrinogen III oxidase